MPIEYDPPILVLPLMLNHLTNSFTQPANFYGWVLFPFYGIVRDLSNNSMPGTYAEALTPLYYRIFYQPNSPNLNARARVTFFLPLLRFFHFATWQ